MFYSVIRMECVVLENVTYWVYGYIAEGRFCVPTEMPIKSKEEAEAIVKNLVDNINYYKFDIIKRTADVETLCSSRKGKFTEEQVKEESERKKYEVIYRIYGYTATVPENIFSGTPIDSLEKALEIVESKSNDIRYYQFMIVKKTGMGDEFVCKQNSNYSQQEVFAHYKEELLKIDNQSIQRDLKKQLKQKSGIKSNRIDSNIEEYFNSQLDLNTQLDQKLKSKRQNNGRYGSTSSEELKRQKSKQKCLAMGGRRY